MKRLPVFKYFWGFNEQALKETGPILSDPSHPQFKQRMMTLLSRCDKPKELFSIITEKGFIDTWPEVRAYWAKIDSESEFRDWWQTIYEQLLQKTGAKIRRPDGSYSDMFLKAGRVIKNARIQKGLSQKELAVIAGMKQPDISRIEEGSKNITLKTLFFLCKVLDIKTIDLP
jgi:DNA-binding Xre family transcriptional regulator